MWRQEWAVNANRSDDMRTPDLSGAHVDIVRFRVFRVVGVEIDRRAVQAR